MDVERPGMRMTTQPVQPAKSLRKRTHTARLGDEIFRIDVRAHFQGLRGDNDQMSLAAPIPIHYILWLGESTG